MGGARDADRGGSAARPGGQGGASLLRRMAGSARAVYLGRDARDDGGRGQSLQPHGRMAGRPAAAFPDGGVELHPGGGEGALGLAEKGGRGAAVPFFSS